MLNALAIEAHQEFFDLSAAFTVLLIQGDADAIVGCRHRARLQPCVCALNIEVTDFTKVEQALVEPCPVRHASAIDVVGEMVDMRETDAGRCAIGSG